MGTRGKAKRCVTYCRISNDPRGTEAGVDRQRADTDRLAGTIVDLGDADSVFTARVLLAAAEKEAANISRRMKRKLQADAEAGRPNWARRPYGYTLDGEPVPAEARKLNEMVDRIIDGESASSAVRPRSEG